MEYFCIFALTLTLQSLCIALCIAVCIAFCIAFCTVVCIAFFALHFASCVMSMIISTIFATLICISGSESFNVINWLMHSKTRDKSPEVQKDQTVRNTVEDLESHRMKRDQEGIVEKCCIKQCSYNHLRTYCSNDCHWLQ